MRFIVVIPVYNGAEWIERCLESVISQNYKDFEVVVIDDYSLDDTWSKIKPYPFYKIHNAEHIGSALANIVRGIKFLSDDAEDVIVTVDGDDYLADDNVLPYLSEVYKEDVWLTYGSFIPLSRKYSSTCWPLDNIRYVRENGTYDYVSLTPQTYRKSGHWVTSHLRTFKKWLWDKIDDRDLRDEGEYYKLAWDMAFMYPMIEMAGKHIRYINRILYMYNDLNPICDGTLNPEEQVRIGELIQSKDVYGELNGHIL